MRFKRKLSGVISTILATSMLFSSMAPVFAQEGDANENIALREGITVISDGTATWGTTPVENAFDGKLDTYWQIKSNAAINRWIGIDAGEGKTITFNKISLYEEAAAATSAVPGYRLTGFRIEVSNDLQTWRSVAEGTTVGEGPVDVTFKVQTARAVRFYTTNAVNNNPVMLKEMGVYCDTAADKDGSEDVFGNITQRDGITVISDGTATWGTTPVENAFDGKLDTYWQIKSNAAINRWIGIDAGEGKTITFNKVTLYEEAATSTSTVPGYRLTGFRIEVSDDLQTWRSVAEGTTVGEGPVDVTFNVQEARAVRFYIIGAVNNNPVMLKEMEVYYDESQVPNIALRDGITVISDGTATYGSTTADKAFDGRLDTKWQINSNAAIKRWIGIDAGEGKTITFNKVTLYEEAAASTSATPGYRCEGYKIEVSDDLQAWTKVAEGTTIGEGPFDVIFRMQTARAVRFYITGAVNNNPVMLKEMEVYYDSAADEGGAEDEPENLPANIALREGMIYVGNEGGFNATKMVNAFDENPSTYWMAAGSTGQGRRLGVDAGEGNTIIFNKVVLSEALDGNDAYRLTGYKIQVTNDAPGADGNSGSWVTVAEGTTIGSTPVEHVFDTQMARAVRFYTTGTNPSNKTPLIAEMEIYYEPEKEDADKNIAINDNYLYIGSMESSEYTGAYTAFDKDLDTYWEPDSSELEGAYVGVDTGVGNSITFDAIKIKEASDNYYKLKSFSVQVSNDDTEYPENWTTISKEGISLGEDIILLPKTTARAVRVLIEEAVGGSPKIAELEIYKTNYSGLNLGRGKTYSGTETWSQTTIDKLFDGDLSTVWQPKSSTGNVIIDAGEGKKFTFDTITLAESYREDIAGYIISGCRMQISDDMKTWYDLPDTKGNGIGNFYSISMPAVTTRALKVSLSALNGRQPSIREMGIYLAGVNDDNYGISTDNMPGTRSYTKAEINEDFETVTNEEFIGEWATTVNKIGQRVSIYKEADGNGSVKLESRKSSVNTSAGIGFSSLGGKFDIEFRMKQLRPADFRMVMGSGDSDKRQPETGRVTFQTTGYFSPLNNSNLAKYNFGEWYRVKVSVDTDKGYFKAYLYNSDNELIATSKDISTKSDRVSSLIFSLEKDDGCVLLDDVKVTTSKDTVKENVTLTPVIFGDEEKIRFYKSDTIGEIDFEPENIEESSFGGRNDMKLDGTGFFRTEKINGRWWIIDPEGHPYFDRSLNRVAYEPEDVITTEKFADSEEWMKWTKSFIDEYGFTGMGNWSSEEINRESQYKMPYTVKVSTFSPYVDYKKEKYPNSDMNFKEIFPFFDADFESFADEFYSNLTQYSEDEYVIGYYTDNEIDIGGSAAADLLDKYLELDPLDEAKKESYDAAWKWLRKECGTNATKADVTDALRKKFKAYVFEKYYEVTTKYIRKYDPNHMILGSRHFSLSLSEKAMWEAAAKYVDVISVNLYNAWRGLDLYQHLADTDKPFIISEFYAKADDSGLNNSTGAGWHVYTQYDRGVYYQSLMLGLIENKNCVGAQWFVYKDTVGSEQNSGVISQEYKLFTQPLDLMKEMNDSVYSLIDYIDSKEAGVVYTDASWVTDEKAYLINPITRAEAGMEVRASAILNDGDMMVACYDSEMNLLSCRISETVENYGKLQSAVVKVPDEAGTYYVKTFVWKDCVPLTEAAVINNLP